MNDLLQAGNIERLPPPPLLERFLFEQPLLPIAVLVLLAIIAVVAFASRNQRRRGLIVAGVLVAVATGVYLASMLVTTERETLLERTEVAIGATAQVEVDAMSEILTEDAYLRTAGAIARVQLPVEGRTEIIDLAARRLQSRYRVGQWEILDRQATIDGPNLGRTLVRVGVDVDGFSRTHYSWWRLHWERGPDGVWRCFELEPLWIQLVGSA
ncbi:MAG: hypothetical protein NCW75_06680 [Phycisphaera sp.]|nr:MAG: hypothetical protein NCW75_06680 [Phycisphaera sp.]